MQKEKIYELIGTAFVAIFPDGFIGRPWDNFYKLLKYSFHDCYDLNFDGLDVKIDKDSQIFTIGKNIFFIIENRCEVVFNGEKKVYNSGVVTFISNSLKVGYKMKDISFSINEAIDLINLK